MTSLANIAELLNEAASLTATDRLRYQYADTYENGHVGGPYPWQEQFHADGAEFPQRCLLAGNRVGKTRTGAAECAIHATGRYPRWWRGHRFTKPILMWVCGIRNEDIREIVQRELCGDVQQERGKAVMSGTGGFPSAIFAMPPSASAASAASSIM